ncbi:hypothetical protein [Formosa sp. A9]|uniref:hypothetical protein n=1 Tax=Formosa sp. A9 TaxID=3442641 RepID=UPI003EB98E65
MDSIIVENFIDENEISVSFDLISGELAFPPITLSIEGDIDLNPLVLELTKLVKFNKPIDYKYNDDAGLIDSNLKIKLIKETLDDLFVAFNENLEVASEGDELEIE